MIEEILIIKIDEIFFAIETSSIDQIMRNLATTPVAFAPDAALGLCATGGKIVTLLDMGRLMKLSDVDQANSDVRLLTLTAPFESISLLCDGVVDTVEVDQEKIEYLDESEDAICAIYKFQDEIVQIIALERLLTSVERATMNLQNVHENLKSTVVTEQASMNTTRFLVFKMADERYAIEIEHLKEILVLPQTFAEIAGAPDSILGMMSLRESLLSVIDLRIEYGLVANRADQNRILVTSINNHQVGLVVDEIVEIRDFDNAALEQMPDQFKDELITGVIHDGKRLVSVIGHETLWQFIKKCDVASEQDTQQQTQNEQLDEIEVVIFSLASEEYAFDIEHVAEIIDDTEVTPVVNTHPFIEGVINIRGQVVSIGSLAFLLGLNASNAVESKIIVTYHEGERIGFRVDHVNAVAAISTADIKASSESDQASVLHLEGGERLVQMIDIAQLILQVEHERG